MKESRVKWINLITILVMTFMCTLDSSIVNVALPVMCEELGTTMGGVEWVVSSYTITICATILLFGKIGDSIGKIKVFKFGIFFFTVGSLLCALSQSLGVLILARVFQGFGASAAMATNQGIITELFPKEERGRALGLGGTFAALGTMVGPTLGGILLSVFPWDSIFIINIPVGIFVVFAVWKLFPHRNRDKVQLTDGFGSALMILSVLLIFTSITLGQSVSFSNPWIVGSFSVGILLLALFILREHQTSNPVIRLSAFRNRVFSLSLFCALLSFIGMGSFNLILPFYLQDALKMSPGMAGIMLTVSPLVLAVFGPLSGYLSDKIGCEIITFVGLVINGIGLLLISSLNMTSYKWEIAVAIAVVAVGNAIFQSPNTSMVMSSVGPNDLGLAGSMNSLVRNLGITIGITVSTTLLYGLMSQKLGYHVNGYVEGQDFVFIFAMHWVFVALAVVVFIGATLTLIRLYQTKKVITKEEK